MKNRRVQHIIVYRMDDELWVVTFRTFEAMEEEHEALLQSGAVIVLAR